MGGFERDSQGMDQMLNSRELFGALFQGLGDAVAAEAAATAPYDENSTDGHYKDSFRVEVGDVTLLSSRGGPHKAVGARVYSDHPAGISIEAGTRHTAAHNTLRHALDIIGGDS